MNEHLFLAAVFNMCLTTGIGLWAFHYRKERRGALSYVYFCVLIFFWNLFYALWQIQTDEKEALFYCEALMAPAGLLGVVLFRIALEYSNRRQPFLLGFAQLCGWTHAVLCFVPGMVVSRVMPNVAGVRWWPHAGPAFPLFFITYTIGFIWGSWIIISDLLQKPGSRAEGIRLLVGTIIGGIAGTTNLFAWYYPLVPALPPYGQSLVCIFQFFVAATILRAKATQLSPGILRLCSVTFVAMILALFASALLRNNQLLLDFAGGNLSSLIGLMVAASVVIVGAVGYLLEMATGMIAGAFSPTTLIADRLLANTQQEIRKASLDDIGTLAARAMAKEINVEKVSIFTIGETQHIGSLLGSTTNASASIILDDESLQLIKQEGQFFLMKSSLIPGEYAYCSPVFEREELKLLVFIGRPFGNIGISGHLATAIESTGMAIYAQLKLLGMARDEAASEQLKELGSMAATLAHDFRNPLTTVKTYVTEPVDDDFTEILRKQAEIDLERMEAAVLSVLEFADTKAGTQRHDMHAVMNKIAALTQTQMAQAGVKFTNDIPPETVYVQAPIHMLITLFSQFYRNASHVLKENHIPHGEIRVRANVVGQVAVIAVTDNGPGVPVQIRDRLFRGMVTTSQNNAPNRSSGFGIGLMSAASITRRLGGVLVYQTFNHELDGDRLSFIVKLKAHTGK